MVRSALLRYIVPAAGSVVMLIGGLLLALRPASPIPRGWSAYAPLSDTTFTPTVIVVPAGLVLLVLGFAALVAWIAYRIGRERSAS
jgi:heme/copper-type cytochrome/quinol oxidase subunit 1